MFRGMDKPLKRPRDPLALAKLIDDIATGQRDDLQTMDAQERRKLISSKKPMRAKSHKPGKRGGSG